MLLAGLCLLAIGFAAWFEYLVSTGQGTPRMFAMVAGILLAVACSAVLATPQYFFLGNYATAALTVAGLLMAPALIGWIIGGAVGFLARPRAQR